MVRRQNFDLFNLVLAHVVRRRNFLAWTYFWVWTHLFGLPGQGMCATCFSRTDKNYIVPELVACPAMRARNAPVGHLDKEIARATLLIQLFFSFIIIGTVPRFLCVSPRSRPAPPVSLNSTGGKTGRAIR